jgi:hypothetical protein
VAGGAVASSRFASAVPVGARVPGFSTCAAGFGCGSDALGEASAWGAAGFVSVGAAGGGAAAGSFGADGCETFGAFGSAAGELGADVGSGEFGSDSDGCLLPHAATRQNTATHARSSGR